MRFFFLGPRLPFGLRPGVSLRPADLGLGGGAPGQIEGGFVYVMEGPRGHKIGVSNDPNRRLTDLQTGSSEQLRLAAAWGTHGSGFDIELRAHSLLASSRLSGEWFDVPAATAIAAVERAIRDTGALATPIPLEHVADVVELARSTGPDAQERQRQINSVVRAAVIAGAVTFAAVLVGLYAFG